MLAVIAVGSTFGAVRTYGKNGPLSPSHALHPDLQVGALTKLGVASAASVSALPAPSASAGPTAKPLAPLGDRPIRVALSQWPGHMALLVGAGGLKTQPGSIASEEGLRLEIQFIEDAPSKNEALRKGEVDFVWQTVDELPISLAPIARQGSTRAPSCRLIGRAAATPASRPKKCKPSRACTARSRQCSCSRPTTRCSSS